MFAKHALVRRPSPNLAEAIVTKIERRPVDVDLALRQWEGYVEALRAAGWETHEMAPSQELPDAVFVEDTMVVYGDLAVIAKMAAPARAGETEAAEEAVRALGFRVARIELPGTLDGGDVLKWGNTVWVGQSGRTNRSGARQLSEYLSRLGARVVRVPVSRGLHLKTGLTALPDGTIIGYEGSVDKPEMFQRFLRVPEPTGAGVLLLGGQFVLMAASAPRTADLLRSRGLDVVTVDISEFEKVEGSVTCLSVRLRGLPGL